MLKDRDGALVNMTTGFTGDASIRDAAGTEVIAPTVTFPASGQVVLAATAAASAAAAVGVHFSELTVTRTSDGAKVVFFGAGDSKFEVKKKVDP